MIINYLNPSSIEALEDDEFYYKWVKHNLIFYLPENLKLRRQICDLYDHKVEKSELVDLKLENRYLISKIRDLDSRLDNLDL